MCSFNTRAHRDLNVFSAKYTNCHCLCYHDNQQYYDQLPQPCMSTQTPMLLQLKNTNDYYDYYYIYKMLLDLIY